MVWCKEHENRDILRHLFMSAHANFARFCFCRRCFDVEAFNHRTSKEQQLSSAKAAGTAAASSEPRSATDAEQKSGGAVVESLGQSSCPSAARVATRQLLQVTWAISG